MHLELLKKKFPQFEFNELSFGELVFEDRVKLACFQCEKYKTNWTCPGKLPTTIDYQQIFLEYNNIILVSNTVDAKHDFPTTRTKSSVDLHKALLQMEGHLFQEHNLNTSFIGGSCKLCKSCNKEKCNFPAKARIPIEATGLNVEETLLNAEIEYININKKQITRYGMILW